jgi:hypothetical protein
VEHSHSGHRQGCHVGGLEAAVGETSTGYFVLALCVGLVVAGLIVTGIVPMPWT